jgi:uncharacterized membrane protein
VRNNLRVPIAWLGFWAALTFPLCVAAQTSAPSNPLVSHHHYKLIVIEPLGGPASSASGPGLVVLNNRGTYAAIANTPNANPNPGCFILGSPADCFTEHAVVWQNGVQTDLGTIPGGNNSQTVGISANGLITGSSESNVIDPYSGLPENVAVLWADNKLIVLGPLPHGTESTGLAVNSRGLVAGFSNNDIPDPFSLAGFTTQTRAVLWHNGMLQDLGTLGGPDALVFGMTETGQVYGQSYTTSTPKPATGAPKLDPFFWENGKMWDLGTLGGNVGVAYFANNSGQVTGDSNLAGDQTQHAFIWDKRRGLKDLGILTGGTFSIANWINESGEVVGAGDDAVTVNGILWKNGAIVNLGVLPGDCYSEALSINSRGQIIGHSSPDCVVDGNAVLWENGGAPVNLNTLVTPPSDVTAVFPLEINDRGEIAAHGFTSSGDLRGVLLIPCDAAHSNLEGCDYSQVEASVPVAFTSAPANPAKALNATRMMRMRARMANRYHRF